MTVLNRDIVPIIFATLKNDLQNSRLMTAFSKKVSLSRVNMYGILKNTHKPSYDKFIDIMNAAGYDVIIVPQESKPKKIIGK